MTKALAIEFHASKNCKRILKVIQDDKHLSTKRPMISNMIIYLFIIVFIFEWYRSYEC